MKYTCIDIFSIKEVNNIRNWTISEEIKVLYFDKISFDNFILHLYNGMLNFYIFNIAFFSFKPNTVHWVESSTGYMEIPESNKHDTFRQDVKLKLYILLLYTIISAL